MHDCVITVWKIVLINIQSFNSRPLSDIGQILMDGWAAVVELPIPSSIANGVSNCGKYHGSNIFIFDVCLLLGVIVVSYHTYMDSIDKFSKESQIKLQNIYRNMALSAIELLHLICLNHIAHHLIRALFIMKPISC